MPSLKSGYTLADFLLRLERSPVTHMSPLYHENRQLFLHRADVFDKVVMSLSWRKGLALLEAAYYSQKIEVSTYRAVLARMLLHNKLVRREHPDAVPGALAASHDGAQFVDWRAALKVFMEALTAHGNAVPSRLAVSTLRLLTPHGQAAAALRVLRIAEANEKLTKPMLLDAAACCANGGEWREALRLLSCLHREDPLLLPEAIQSLRPVGSDALSTPPPMISPSDTSHDGGNALSSSGEGHFAVAPLFPGNTPHPSPPTVTQKHILHVLNTVVAAVPAEVALADELCFSYLTHLTASTTLSAEEKAAALGAAIARLGWPETALLLNTYAEPNLLEDGEWRSLLGRLPHPSQLDLLSGEGEGNTTTTTGASKMKKRKSRQQLKVQRLPNAKQKVKKRRKTARSQPDCPAAAESSDGAVECEESGISPAQDEGGDATEEKGSAVALLTSSLVSGTVATRLRLAHCSPATAAAFLAVLVGKVPTVRDAWELVNRTCRDADTGVGGEQDKPELPLFPTPSVSAEAHTTLVSDADIHEAVAVAAHLHPVVRRALLRCCAAAPAEEAAWRVAAVVLLAQGSAHGPTPAGVLSPLVLQLRAAKQVPLLMRVLLEHIVPTHSKLTEDALVAMLQTVLAHNRAAHRVQYEQARAVVEAHKANAAGTKIKEGTTPLSSALSSAAAVVVHWRSVMGWAVDLRAPEKEQRIVQTGTGASLGGVERRPPALVKEEQPLSPRLLSLLIHLCVDAGSPQGALDALGRARRADKTELALASEIQAVLYCVLYDRPYEAEAIVLQAERKKDEALAAPLRQLLHLAQSAKLREEAVALASELADD